MVKRVICRCPVGGEVLGYTHLGSAAALLCYDCGWVYPWDEKGKLGTPWKPTKPKQTCGCHAHSDDRDSHKSDS